MIAFPRLRSLALPCIAALTLGALPSPASAFDAAEEAELERLLPDRAWLVGAVGLSLYVGGADGGGLGFIGSLDLPILHPLWLGARAKNLGPRVYFDSLVSFSFSHSRDFGIDSEIQTETVGETSTHYIRRQSVYSRAAVIREDFLFTAGIKHDWIRETEKDEHALNSFSGLNSQMLMFGLQWQTATHVGAHDFVELYGLYNQDSGKMGLQAIWRNSPADIPWVYVGMDVAYLPTISSTDFYWALVEIGTTFEL